LHEVAVVGFFLAEGGNELAERYLAHDQVESWRAAQQYQEFCERLGREPFPDAVMRKMETEFDSLCQRYGPDFGHPYGWASETLRRRSPRFADIERAMEMDHVRPLYKLASHPTHAGPKGVLFRLGLLGDEIRILPGASNVGLADPGAGACVSLMQSTVCLLAHGPGAPTMRSLQVMIAMQRIVEEAGEEFGRIQAALEDEAKDSQPRVGGVVDLDGHRGLRRFRRSSD
jgi:hypothetical protein